MSAPSKPVKTRWQEMRGLKSLLSIAIVLVIYMWASSGLGISVGKFASGETWANMGDLVMKLANFEAINTCNLANQAWGPNNQITEKHYPEKVKAVCEDEKTLYLYQGMGSFKETLQFAKDSLPDLLQTFRMAIVGTAIGALLAIPFSLLAARNLVKSKVLYYLIRSILNLIRTIPDMVLAAVLSGAFGLGALPGVMALSVFAFALVAKLLSESIEAIDPGPLEAMQAVGGNRLQQIRYGVVPQVLPQYLAYTLYVLEICVRASTILGLVGAGGIGQRLYADLNLMRYPKVGAVIAVMMIAVMMMDFVSTKLRERLV